MREQQSGSQAARTVFSEEETQHENVSRNDVVSIRGAEEAAESGIRGTASAAAVSAERSMRPLVQAGAADGSALGHAVSVPFSALEEGAGGRPAASCMEDSTAGGASIKEDYGDSDGKVTHASALSERTESRTKNEDQQPLNSDAPAGTLEMEDGANRQAVQVPEGAGADAVEEKKLDTETATPYETLSGSHAPGGRKISDGSSCATRETDACRADDNRHPHPECGAELHAAAADSQQPEPHRERRVECSEGSDSGVQRNGMGTILQDRSDPEGRARANTSNTGGSDAGPAGKVANVENGAADKITGEPERGEAPASTTPLAEKNEPRVDAGVGAKDSLERERLHGGGALGEESMVATSRISSAAAGEDNIVSRPSERLAKPTNRDPSSVDAQGQTNESSSTDPKAERSTYVTDSDTYAAQDRKAVEAQTVVTGDVKPASGTNTSEAEKSNAERNKLVAVSTAGVESSCSLADKEDDVESSRSADPSTGAMESSKSASESKDEVTNTQEGGGSGAEEEEDEEEGELLHGGLSGESEKKEYMASKKRGGVEVASRGKPLSPRSLSPSPCHYRRKRRRGENGAVATRCKVNVGPRHQVPALPPFFLDSSCARDERADRLPETRELYNHDAGDTARLVYSPFAMQRVYRKRLAEGSAAECGIRTADDMNEFIRKVAENWTSKSGWQPFSPEYAYKLLHFAGYDPQRALRIMKDSRFCFTTICDPPQRRYDNKWRPKDRRGQIATHPYPSPLTLRAYLSRKNQHAVAAAAAENASTSV